MLTEWVLVSLPNFTWRAPLSYSLWCLSCFFLAASPNPWLQVNYQHKYSLKSRPWVFQVSGLVKVREVFIKKKSVKFFTVGGVSRF